MKNRARRLQALVVVTVAVVLLVAVPTLLRADAPDGRFTAVAGGVQDSVTGLIWQMPASTTKYFGGNTATACTTPFRVPTIQELFTLLDVRRTANPLFDQIFTDGSNSAYWSSTPQVGGTGHWCVDFAIGGTTHPDDSVQNLVRCVQ